MDRLGIGRLGYLHLWHGQAGILAGYGIVMLLYGQDGILAAEYCKAKVLTG